MKPPNWIGSVFGQRATAGGAELQRPEAASGDPNSLEVLRVWIVRGDQHVALRTGVWEDPAAWGLLLVDLAKHVANAYEQGGGPDRAEVLKRIKAGLDAEWASPTDEASGRIQPD